MKKTKNKEELLKSPKGMRDLIGNDFFHLQGFMEKAAEISMYYGFQPIETTMLEKEELFNRSVGENSDIVTKEMYTIKTKGGDHLALRPETTAGVMRAYFEHGMQSWPQPVMLFNYGPVFRHDNPQKGRWRQFYQFNLEVIGTKKSVADAMVIMILYTILKEAGLKDISVQINSIGDSDCRNSYRRELVNYYKKHLKGICADCRERLKTNPLRLLDCKNPHCQEVKQNAPESVAYLCAPCKAHFKEVLEYLDSFGISYEINSNLVRGLDYYSRTVFEIVSNKKTVAEDGVESNSTLSLAGGGRYDYLAKVLTGKKDVPATGGAIGVDRVLMQEEYAKLTPRIVKKPKIFFIQLSQDAKQKSFEIIEILRKAKVSITQSLAKDSLSVQLALAEKAGVPFAIILGQKEALESTVIVRNMDNRSQYTVKIDKLAEYLKKNL
ncbi:MAG: Histidine-tRNA ligase [Parcubacteria group bacterium GW2011_GWC1_43_11b]|uniref:Histidine--tRNA ligase n=2 Tax=Candidatus Vogeliibacteriota TaxID=1817922 RepID=A0A1G2QC77_9BACT|nr:MAG: Histidine-tRNA ligase [Parcubacteria group bacterium GW2011_GWB1_42_9]KKS89562.1 MAG: Histidine-tRNA ligase [Parcubacteria group bacterium GW2011_GWC1_43_11b]KKT09881.1 MAG: Histidine-tRNA ligase [Parcubacteria group bacterium GW2011_GWA1_43_21]OHA58176.1 MAG: histidine--tRNA ligase [Candidatus Vogelbacteria bacterium RIFOXYB1_FULL_42_16]OHA59199.1 MAG: histidine--tRNA ligase [Candidatus Vogelbacteria bacterium RIFOXYD1_FULL_42_15]